MTHSAPVRTRTLYTFIFFLSIFEVAGYVIFMFLIYPELYRLLKGKVHFIFTISEIKIVFVILHKNFYVHKLNIIKNLRYGVE